MGVVYCIENIVNNKKYIGQSIDFDFRKKTHLKKLKTNTHGNSHLQSSWNKYGEKFCFFCSRNC